MAVSKLSPADEYVTCIDGPKAGFWWTRADWDVAVDAATYMAEQMGPFARPNAYLAYRPALDPLTEQPAVVRHPTPSVNPDVYAAAMTAAAPPNPTRSPR